MVNEALLVAVDSGTQSVRVIIFDVFGNIVSSAVAQHESVFQLSPGWAEQHSDDIWAKFCLATQEALHHLPSEHPPLVALGFTGQRGTTCLLDENGRPLRAFVTWLDPRRKGLAHWIREHEPENYQRTYKISSVQGLKQISTQMQISSSHLTVSI